MRTKPIMTAMVLLAGIMISAAQPAARETGLYRMLPQWQIRVDPDLGHGCFMQAHFVNGVFLRIGINNAVRTSYLQLFNPAWTSLQPGKFYTVHIGFNGVVRETWEGKAVNLSDGTPAILFPFDNGYVWHLVAASATINIVHEGRPVLTGDLTGSSDAARAVFECQANFASPGIADPFAPAV